MLSSWPVAAAAHTMSAFKSASDLMPDNAMMSLAVTVRKYPSNHRCRARGVSVAASGYPPRQACRK